MRFGCRRVREQPSILGLLDRMTDRKAPRSTRKLAAERYKNIEREHPEYCRVIDEYLDSQRLTA